MRNNNSAAKAARLTYPEQASQESKEEYYVFSNSPSAFGPWNKSPAYQGLGSLEWMQTPPQLTSVFDPS